MDAHSIISLARRGLGRICQDDCHAYCCRKGTITLTKKSAEMVCKDFSGLLQRKILVPQGNKFTMHFSANNDSCPSLENNRCIIYAHRPLVCRSFPIFLSKRNVYFHPGCLAVRQGYFYPYESKLIRLGYNILSATEFIEEFMLE